jgi:hypothetical protein
MAVEQIDDLALELLFHGSPLQGHSFDRLNPLASN